MRQKQEAEDRLKQEDETKKAHEIARVKRQADLWAAFLKQREDNDEKSGAAVKAAITTTAPVNDAGVPDHSNQRFWKDGIRATMKIIDYKKLPSTTHTQRADWIVIDLRFVEPDVATNRVNQFCRDALKLCTTKSQLAFIVDPKYLPSILGSLWPHLNLNPGTDPSLKYVGVYMAGHHTQSVAKLNTFEYNISKWLRTEPSGVRQDIFNIVVVDVSLSSSPSSSSSASSSSSSSLSSYGKCPLHA